MTCSHRVRVSRVGHQLDGSAGHTASFDVSTTDVTPSPGWLVWLRISRVCRGERARRLQTKHAAAGLSRLLRAPLTAPGPTRCPAPAAGKAAAAPATRSTHSRHDAGTVAPLDVVLSEPGVQPSQLTKAVRRARTQRVVDRPPGRRVI